MFFFCQVFGNPDVDADQQITFPVTIDFRQSLVSQPQYPARLRTRIHLDLDLAVDRGDLDRVCDPHVRMSLELQQAFGLRREEAIKFNPSYADRGDHLILKDTWTKGGKARQISVRNQAQREVLARAHRLAGLGSLIPRERNYRQQLRVYERHTANAGLSKLHGLRHAYAQSRYEELTGWKAPAEGGSAPRTLTPEQRGLDRQARLTISRELGHEREQITAVYLGR